MVEDNEDGTTTETAKLYTEGERNLFTTLASQADKVIGHNAIHFDFRILDLLWGIRFEPEQMLDTLVLSQLANPVREGGHSLEAWGRKLSFPKVEFDPSLFYQGYTEEMGLYCMQDTKLTCKLYKVLKTELHKFSGDSIKLEHRVRMILSEQELNGFALDQENACILVAELNDELVQIKEDMQKVFPPTEVQLKTKVKYIPFNPGSRKQVGERLMEKGWVPEKKTDLGTPVLDESVLSGIDMEEAKIVGRYMMLQKRIAQINSWIDAVNPETGRVHGKVLTLRTITGRMAHASPNMAQVPAVYSPYGPECRRLWVPGNPKKQNLVGIDASSIELRMLCHYMNDPEYTEIVVSGDIHTANQERAGLSSRSQSKTFIYAFLYGAGAAKIGSIVEGSAKDGQELIDNFLEATPALQEARHRVTLTAERSGIIRGLDGRMLWIRSPHAALNTQLQGAAAVVMKRALLIFHKELASSPCAGRAKFVANVHDEWQLEVDKPLSDMVGTLGIESIKKAGEYYKLNCPLTGEYNVGTNWAETH
jgi:DNA polymerase I-like protein with 3'-5' exonuclease and polymerase domains